MNTQKTEPPAPLGAPTPDYTAEYIWTTAHAEYCAGLCVRADRDADTEEASKRAISVIRAVIDNDRLTIAQDAERLRGELATAQILNETLRAQLSSRERIGNAREQPGSAICAIEHWGWVQATFDAPHGWKVELLFKKDATDDLCDVGSHASAWHKSFVVAAEDALRRAGSEAKTADLHAAIDGYWDAAFH